MRAEEPAAIRLGPRQSFIHNSDLGHYRLTTKTQRGVG